MEKLPEIDIFCRKYQGINNEHSVDQAHSSKSKIWYPTDDFPNVYLIFRNFVCRRTYLDKEGLNKVMDSMVEYLENTQLTSAVIRQITSALYSLKPQHKLSRLVDRIITYILDNRNHVHTHTTLRPLMLAYHSSDDVLESSKGMPLLKTLDNTLIWAGKSNFCLETPCFQPVII
jgi:hypothetical protein